MKQTNEWVLIVLNSATERYQVYDETREKHRPGWFRVLLKLFALGSRIYGIPRLP